MEKLKFERIYVSFLGYVEALPIHISFQYEWGIVNQKNILTTISPLNEIWRVGTCNGSKTLHTTKHSSFLLLIEESYDKMHECFHSCISLVKRDSMEFNPAIPPCPIQEKVDQIKVLLSQ